MSTTSNDTSKTSETPSPETSQEQEELSPQLDAFLNEMAKWAALRQVLKEIESGRLKPGEQSNPNSQ